MYLRFVTIACLFFVVSTVRAQDLPLGTDARNPRDLLASNGNAIQEPEEFTLRDPTPDALFPNANSEALPNKPQPVAYEGQWIVEGEQLPQFSSDLIMVVRKDDGRMMWHVEKVNSCAWCGAPLTWKQAAFDKKASSMWILRSALVVADVEITHHLPCFQAGTCKEWNPLLGQTRLQGYSVGAGLTAIAWAGDAWLRKGSRKDHIGGYRRWWIIPTVGYAASAVGIVANLARWHSR